MIMAGTILGRMSVGKVAAESEFGAHAIEPALHIGAGDPCNGHRAEDPAADADGRAALRSPRPQVRRDRGTRRGRSERPARRYQDRAAHRPARAGSGKVARGVAQVLLSPQIGRRSAW